MKTFNFNLICSFLIFAIFISTPSFSTEGPLPDDAEEEMKLDDLYSFPMIAIRDLLNQTLKHCKRLPDEKEFRDFILQGSGPNIDCTLKIKTTFQTHKSFFRPHQSKGEAIGKDIPNLPELLQRNQHQVFSNTKIIYVILKQNPSKWTHKHFKAQDYDKFVYCDYRMRKCDYGGLNLQIKSCRNNKSFAKRNCFFGGKKIIDYD